MRSGMMVVLASASAGCSLYFDHGNHSGPPDAMHGCNGSSVACDAFIGDAAIDFTAACKAPQGPAITVDASQVAAQLAGRWWLCGGAAEFFGNVEFTADMRFYMLSNVNGQFVRNLGPMSSGTYSVDPAPTGILFYIHQHYQDGSGAGYPLRGYIEEAPRVLVLGGGGYVAIP